MCCRCVWSFVVVYWVDLVCCGLVVVYGVDWSVVDQSLQFEV